MSGREGEPFEPPFDLDRLTPGNRELWEECFIGPLGDEGPAVRVWGFGYACMMFGDGVPEEVAEYLEEGGSGEKIRQYLDNVRAARDRGEI